MKSLAVSDRYGWPRYVAHQAYYSLVGRDYEWELMPLALDQRVGAVVWSPLGWGRLTGKIRRGQPLPETSRLHATRRRAPPVDDEHLYTVVDALDAVAGKRARPSRRSRSTGCCSGPPSPRHHRRPQRGAAAREPGRGRLEPDARAGREARRGQRRDPAYPYWHQRGKAELDIARALRRHDRRAHPANHQRRRAVVVAGSELRTAPSQPNRDPRKHPGAVQRAPTGP